MAENTPGMNSEGFEYKIDWGYLSTNPNAIDLLKENQDKINWDLLISNPNAIEVLKYNQDKIDWCMLSSNINAIDLSLIHI